ncbi:MAG: LPS export ABC transporter permease LptG [Nitrospiria bacterium]
MSLLIRYILKEYFKVYFATVVALALIVFSIDFLEKIRHLYRFDPAFQLLAGYFLLRLPRMLFEIMPLAVLLSTLITFGGLSKRNEVTAFKSAGISVFKLALPMFVFGIGVSLISHHLTGGLIPIASKKSNWIRNVKIEKKAPVGGFVQNKTWMRLGNGKLIYIRSIDSVSEEMRGIDLYTLSDDFTLIEEDEAETLFYEGDEWFLEDGVHRTFFPDGSQKSTPFKQKKVHLNKKPADFKKVTLKIKEMTHRDLRTYIQQLSEDHLNALRYRVALSGKEALSYANFIMVLLGIPFALKDNRSGGLAWGVAISLAVALVYWLIFSMGQSLGRLAILPPALAGWSANVLFLTIGVYLLLNIRQ